MLRKQRARRLSGALPLFVVWLARGLCAPGRGPSQPARADARRCRAGDGRLAAGRLAYAKRSLRRPPYEAAVLGGIALLLLGLAPEEGPVGLLLWFVFGVTWPILHEALGADAVARLGRAAVLLAGMILPARWPQVRARG